MKYLLLALLFIACQSKKPIKSWSEQRASSEKTIDSSRRNPSLWHNSNTNKFVLYMGQQSFQDSFFNMERDAFFKPGNQWDSIITPDVSQAYQSTDADSLMKLFQSTVATCDNEKAKKDRADAIQRSYEDSIEKTKAFKPIK